MSAGGGRPRQRGVRRDKHSVTLSRPAASRVQQLADAEHGGNFSAALEVVVQRGLHFSDPAAGVALQAAAAEVDRLTRS